ncbi:MAG: homoserine O-acetyltransferase [Verrucomicrobia bacterium]|nr:homoserine O-acetyltransferase [Verrucomicrobiota bacterium]
MSDPTTTEDSVGLVETKNVAINLPPEGLVLENGESLPELQVVYESYGKLAPAGDNVIYICHALTGDAHVAGYYSSQDKKSGWWDAMVGPGKGIDTNRFHVICANILGGCMGTTGPSALNPRTGCPYGSSFPAITTGDMVHVQYLLLQHLGIKRLAAVIGGSFGGMQVLEWIRRYPLVVDKGVCIASAMSLSAQALAFDIVGRNAIQADSAWAGGNYYGKAQTPVLGLAQARMIGHITYLSSENMKRKFGREKKAIHEPLPRFATPFQVESYLDYQGSKFVDRFDANSYLHITEAMDIFDLAENCADPAEAFRSVDPRTHVLVVALSSDWLFPPEQSLAVARALVRAGKHVSYCLLPSPYGHDAFLVEVEHLTDVLRTFLESVSASCPAPPERSRLGVALRRSLVAEASADTRVSNRPSTPPPPRRLVHKRVHGELEREDYIRIVEQIIPGARVLDLGCGDGELLCELMARKTITGLGMDIDLEHVISVLHKGLDVFQCDLDAGLNVIPDRSYDYAVLSQTLQVVRKPRLVLNEMLRVAREGIVSFPNFGNWRHRLRLGLKGRMPVSGTLPFEWYDTPNIHLSTLEDFHSLCRMDHIRIVDTVCIPRGWGDAALLRLGLRNLGSDRVLIRIARE